MESRKMDWESYVQDSKGDADIKDRLVYSVGEGEGRMIWGNSMETYVTIGKIDNQGEFDAWSRVPKAGALWQPRGIVWEGGGS